jgi:hypothetical protein
VQVFPSLWHIDPWLASPLVFAIGVALMYARWPVARISAVFFLACGLLLAWTPGDPDNWWLAVVLVVVGTLLVAIIRPPWLRQWRGGKSKLRFRFSLRDLVIASCVFGFCLSLVLRAVQYRAEQSTLRESVYPILQDYAATVAFDSGHIRLLSTNNLPRHADPLYAKARACGFSHWYASNEQTRSFTDQDLARIADRHGMVRFLDVRQSGVTADGLVVLEKLEFLEGLWLDAAQCTPIATEHLKKVDNLQALSIDQPADAQLKLLREALPKCEIQVSGSYDSG